MDRGFITHSVKMGEKAGQADLQLQVSTKVGSGLDPACAELICFWQL